MYIFVLILHVAVALVLSVSMFTVVMAAYKQQETQAYLAMMVSFGLTSISGIGLLLLNAGVIGRVCALMSLFTISVLLVGRYYRLQLEKRAS